MGIIALCAKVARMSWNIDEDDGPVGDDLRARVVEARNEHDAMKTEIARLKAEVETRRIERDNARETSNLRATRIERMERALAAGPAALRDITDDYDGAAEIVEAAQEAALKEWK